MNMDFTIRELGAELNQTEREIERLKRALNSAPEGALVESTCRGKRQYYQFISGNPSQRIYLSADNRDLIDKLAQKKYNMKLLTLLEHNAALLKRSYTLLCQNEDLSAVDSLFSGPNQLILRKSLLTDSAKLENWLNQYASCLDSMDEGKRFQTKRGEWVRSKSEEIIANLLLELGLPYQYERGLMLTERMIYPDFTIYDLHHDCEVYWEHFGLLDSDDYMRKTWNKISLYERNGYITGDQFLFSYEMKTATFNEREIREKLLKRFFPEQLC